MSAPSSGFQRKPSKNQHEAGSKLSGLVYCLLRTGFLLLKRRILRFRYASVVCAATPYADAHEDVFKSGSTTNINRLMVYVEKIAVCSEKQNEPHKKNNTMLQLSCKEG
jgi:hypothetical protein